MKPASSTIKAAGIGGLLAGVPIGGYLGSITMGVIAGAWPELSDRLAGIGDLQSAISGVYTVIIAVGIGRYKKENVLQVAR